MSEHCPIQGVWILGRPKCPRYGSFPCGFLGRARDVLGVPLSEPILHVCGGAVREYSSPERGVSPGVPVRGFGPNDKTLDLDPTMAPDFLQDAREALPLQRCFKCNGAKRCGRRPDETYPCSWCAGLGGFEWPAILIDRPYTLEDADHYPPGRDQLPEAKLLLRNALEAVRPGGRVGILDYCWPRPPKGARLVALFGVICGFDNRMRAFSVFERPEAG